MICRVCKEVVDEPDAQFCPFCGMQIRASQASDPDRRAHATTDAPGSSRRSQLHPLLEILKKDRRYSWIVSEQPISPAANLIPILPVKTVYNPTKLAPHGRRRWTDATLAIGMERERRRTETMIPERERPPNADAPAGVVVVAQRAVYPRRSRRHWLSPADGAIRGGVVSEGGARRRASPSQGRAWSCLPTERRAGRRAEAEGC